MRIFAVGNKISGVGGVANIGGGAVPPGPNVEPPLEIWDVWRPQIGRKKVWRFLTQQFNCTCTAQCAGVLSCWNTVVTRHSAYCWQQYDVIMTSWSSIEDVSKRYHQNFLLCNNNEITACIADLFNLFVKKYVRLHFQGNATTNYRWSGKFSYVFVGI